MKFNGFFEGARLKRERVQKLTVVRSMHWMNLIAWSMLLLFSFELVLLHSQIRAYIPLAVMGVALLCNMLILDANPILAVKIFVIGAWASATIYNISDTSSFASVAIAYSLAIAISGWLLDRKWVFALTTVSVIVFLYSEYDFLRVGLRGHPYLIGGFLVAMAVSLFLIGIRIHFLNIRGIQDAAGVQNSILFDKENEISILLSNVPAAIASFDIGFRVLRCNQRFASLYGRISQELIGLTLFDFVDADALALDFVYWKDAIGGEQRHFRTHIIHPISSDVSWLDVSLTPEYRDGQLFGIYCLAVDVTEDVEREEKIRYLHLDLEVKMNKRTEELEHVMEELQSSRNELIRTQSHVAISTMMASVAHELSSPLGNSLLAATALAEQMPAMNAVDSPINTSQAYQDVFHGIRLVVSNLERAQSILRHFKQVSVDQISERRRAFDLRDLIGEIIFTLGPSIRHTSHKICNNIPSGLVMDSFPGPIGQVVINIINNAFMHAFDDRERGLLSIDAKSIETSVRLTFSDNGKGMSGDILPRVLEPFFSTKFGKGGTGLGMSIVNNIVTKSLCGKLSILSTPGEGTQIIVDLPFVSEANLSTYRL